MCLGPSGGQVATVRAPAKGSMPLACLTPTTAPELRLTQKASGA